MFVSFAETMQMHTRNFLRLCDFLLVLSLYLLSHSLCYREHAGERGGERGLLAQCFSNWGPVPHHWYQLVPEPASLHQ